MSDATVAVVIAFLGLVSCAFYNWWARMLFLAGWFKCSGSFYKRKKEYRKRWSFLERLLLIPLFSKPRAIAYVIFATANYCHFAIAFESAAKAMFCYVYKTKGADYRGELFAVGFIIFAETFIADFCRRHTGR